MSYETLQTQLNQGVALIWLNRPELRNAMNDIVIAELTDAFERAGDDDEVRAIVLAGHGSAFCAGGDLGWMKRAREFTPEENRADAAKLAKMLRTIYENRSRSSRASTGRRSPAGWGWSPPATSRSPAPTRSSACPR